jgi:hypothetical protein
MPEEPRHVSSSPPVSHHPPSPSAIKPCSFSFSPIISLGPTINSPPIVHVGYCVRMGKAVVRRQTGRFRLLVGVCSATGNVPGAPLNPTTEETVMMNFKLWRIIFAFLAGFCFPMAVAAFAREYYGWAIGFGIGFFFNLFAWHICNEEVKNKQ